MRVLLASSEVYPYSKTGGLADMVSSLGKTLARAGHHVGIVTPLYAGIRERAGRLQALPLAVEVPLGAQKVGAKIWSAEPAAGLTIYFVDQPGFYDRPGIYQDNHATDYPDNAERFVFFSKVVAFLSKSLLWRPEVLHLHDWQASPAAAILHRERTAGQGTVPPVCLTIHNLAYQGLFPPSSFGLLNLPWDYFTADRLEFYGKVNCLKAGIVFSDIITTVSPRYAREITTEEYGCGLDGLLRQRNDSLVGILNGVDYEEWNPGADRFLKHPYSADDLSGKAASKLALQQEAGLPVNAAIPLFGNIGRLAEQKGVDIMLAALADKLPSGFQFVLVGSGSPTFEKAYADLARRFPAQVSVKFAFDEGYSHRIEAGSDFFLMPSRFEPCGLNQMYGLRYATIPVVRTTGGLDDTVIDAREDAAGANGIKFVEYSAAALGKGIEKALALYRAPEALAHYRRNAMAVDFSWERMVAEYSKIYEQAKISATRKSATAAG
jgi:starch synthase